MNPDESSSAQIAEVLSVVVNLLGLFAAPRVREASDPLTIEAAVRELRTRLPEIAANAWLAKDTELPSLCGDIVRQLDEPTDLVGAQETARGILDVLGIQPPPDGWDDWELPTNDDGPSNA